MLVYYHYLIGNKDIWCQLCDKRVHEGFYLRGNNAIPVVVYTCPHQSGIIWVLHPLFLDLFTLLSLSAIFHNVFEVAILLPAGVPRLFFSSPHFTEGVSLL